MPDRGSRGLGGQLISLPVQGGRPAGGAQQLARCCRSSARGHLPLRATLTLGRVRPNHTLRGKARTQTSERGWASTRGVRTLYKSEPRGSSHPSKALGAGRAVPGGTNGEAQVESGHQDPHRGRTPENAIVRDGRSVGTRKTGKWLGTRRCHPH